MDAVDERSAQEARRASARTEAHRTLIAGAAQTRVHLDCMDVELAKGPEAMDARLVVHHALKAVDELAHAVNLALYRIVEAGGGRDAIEG